MVRVAEGKLKEVLLQWLWTQTNRGYPFEIVQIISCCRVITIMYLGQSYVLKSEMGLKACFSTGPCVQVLVHMYGSQYLRNFLKIKFYW